MLGVSVVCGMRGVDGVCVKYMCMARALWKVGSEWRIWFGPYQSCKNRGSVGCLTVFGLWWCGWCRLGVGGD